MRPFASESSSAWPCCAL